MLKITHLHQTYALSYTVIWYIIVRLYVSNIATVTFEAICTPNFQLDSQPTLTWEQSHWTFQWSFPLINNYRKFGTDWM